MTVKVSTRKAYPPGVHVPSLTWFENTTEQEISWPTQKKHFQFLVESGLHGVVIAGTNGEVVALSTEEKSQLVRTLREIAVQNGRADMPITLGCSGRSTREVIAETLQAKEAGADYVLVLVPSYFHFAMSEDAIVSFFQELADNSPLPVIIYNFPGVVAGLDVNSDMLSTLGRHPNIVGVKLTCGGIAKVARVRAEFEPEQFSALAGQSDWLVPAMAVGGTGVITGVANLYPRFCAKIYDDYLAGRKQAAESAQLKLAQMEWGFGKGGINGTKWVVAKGLGYPLDICHCRRPYPRFLDAEKQAWLERVVRTLAEDEKRLRTAA